MPAMLPDLADDLERVALLVDPEAGQWAEDPVGWARERLGVKLWSGQARIAESVRDHTQTAVRSCHEVGKSFAAALVTCWWLDAHPPGTARVVTTAPSAPQVKAILWHEINKLKALGGLPGRTNLTEWYIDGQLVAFGRKPNERNPSAFHGAHARYMLVVLDEACGVPGTLYAAAHSLAANEHSRILAIGNPDFTGGDFERAFKPDSGWNTIHIGYRDTPNFTGEPVSKAVADSLIHPSWVKARADDWGADSALFAAKCDGNFPADDSAGAIPNSMVQPCRYLELSDRKPWEGGVDVGAGGDRTVIRERRGPRAGREEVFQDRDPMRTVGRLVEKIVEWKLERVKVDVIGIGWGIYGRLRELSTKHGARPDGPGVHGAEVVPVNFGAGPSKGNEDRFANMRAEVYWTVGRERSRLQTWDLALVDDEVLAELTAARYEIMDSKGKIKIEAKDKVIERTGRSPDRSDALLLAFYEASAPMQTGSTNALTSANFTRGLGVYGGRKA